MKKLALSAVAAATLVGGLASATTYLAYDDQLAVSGGAITAATFAFGHASSAYGRADAVTNFTGFEANCGSDVLVPCSGAVGGSPFLDNLDPGAGGGIAPIPGLYDFVEALNFDDVSASR